MTKRTHDSTYYKDLELVKKAERLRKQGFFVHVGGSVHCPEENCNSSIPLDDHEVESNYYVHGAACPRRKQVKTETKRS